MNMSTFVDCPIRLRWLGLCLLVSLSACVSPPTSSPPPPVKVSEPQELPPPAPAPVAVAPATPPEPTVNHVSKARTDREFRKDAARHIYEQNAHRIYSGRMPPLLKAVGVMDVVVDRRGNVLRVEWRRAPNMRPM